MEKAAVSLAVGAVTPIITKLANVVDSYFGGDIASKELADLKTTILPKIQAVIKVANKIDSDELKPWLLKLKSDLCKAEDLLDEYNYNNIEEEVSALPNTLKIIKGKAKDLLGSIWLKTELKKSMENLQQSADEADKLVPLLGVINESFAQPAIQQQRPTVSGLSSPVFGRDEEIKFLINILINNDGLHKSTTSSSGNNNIHVHAICGVGGAGKTTLAQYLCKNEKVETHFDLKIWVHVSPTFDVARITKEIIISASHTKSAPDGNLDVLQREVKEILKSKRFLLILDDIWCEDKEIWDQLLIPFNECGNVGSRILITTRTHHIASILGIKNIHNLNELKTDDCWSIVKHYAFGEANKIIQDSELRHVGDEIVQKLKYSPLAARVIGCSLGRKVNVYDWKLILKDDMLKDTKDTLLLSFQHLPSHLKRCFAFCSLFPKGFHFEDIDDLVRLWIAQGFVEAANNYEVTLEERGRQYFNDLLSYSFFVDGLNCDNQCVYTIPDLLHDIAEQVSKDDCLRIEGDGLTSIPKTIMHLSIATENLMNMPNIIMLKNLRTLIILSSSYVDFDARNMEKIFENLTKLRVLDFGNYMIQEFHSSVCQLKHLRYLKARSTRKLSKSFCKLYNLQFLILYGNEIEDVPKSLNNLINLRSMHTDLQGKYILQQVPKIGKLTSLQILNDYNVKTTADYSMGQLKNLNQLRGVLRIWDLENVRDGAEAAAAKLKDKRHLDSLYLSWSSVDGTRNSRGDEEVLECLDPHPNLTNLGIECYQGTKLSKWLISNHEYCLSNLLQSLELSSCQSLRKVPCLPNRLQKFVLLGCNKLTVVSSLPHNLYYLYIIKCPKLKKLAAFPCTLDDIYIYECPEIKSLIWTPSYYSLKGNDENNDYGRQKNEDSYPSIYSLQKSYESLLRLEGRNINLINLTAVMDLCFSSCKNLCNLEGIGSLPLLERLVILGCPKLSLLGNLQPLPSLKYFTVRKCPELTTTTTTTTTTGEGECAERASDRLLSLQVQLTIDEPMLLSVLLEEQCINSLKQLFITTSQDIPFSVKQEEMFLHLTSLSHLLFSECENLPCLPGILNKISSLQKLQLVSCNKMESLPDLPTSLESLEIAYCDQLESLPDMPASLQSLTMLGCHPHIIENYGEGGPLRHKIAHIPNICMF